MTTLSTIKTKAVGGLRDKFIGFNDRGIVYYSDGLMATGYTTPSACCINCGAKAKGEKARKWQFGHVGCPKPNGDYLRNDFTTNDLKDFLLSEIDRVVEVVMEEIKKMKEEELSMKPADDLERTAEWYKVTALDDLLQKLKEVG